MLYYPHSPLGLWRTWAIQKRTTSRRLDDFLGNPAYSPHGEAIPDTQGRTRSKVQVVLSQLAEGSSGIVMAVKEDTPLFLQYLGKRGIYLGAKISVIEKIAFDQSMDISIDGHPKVNLSLQASNNIFMTP